MSQVLRILNQIAIALVLVLLAAPASSAQDTKSRDRLLVDVDWLAEHYQDPGLVLIQFGPEEDYAEGHIPGAVFLSFNDIAAPHDHEDASSLALELPENAVLQQVLRNAGIDQDSRIVVYWSSEWITPTSRMMLTLDYAGLGSQSAMLNGGLEAWVAAGLPVTEEPSQVEPGNFTMAPREDLIVTAGWVQEHAGSEGIVIIDARSPAYYDGVKESDAGAGHIPGAVNVDWRGLLDGEPATWRSAQSLAAIFQEAGVQPGDTIVGYCHVGQYATAMLFAARTLGYDVKLYDGSMQDWGGIRKLPLEQANMAEPTGESSGR